VKVLGKLWGFLLMLREESKDKIAKKWRKRRENNVGELIKMKVDHS